MKKQFIMYWLSIFMFLLPISNYAQKLAYENSASIVLEDGTTVQVYGTLDGEDYYYLPPSSALKLGKNANGTDEFLFLNFTTNERIEAGGTQGAILHFLMEWGLTPAQMEDLALQIEDLGGRLRGPVDLQSDNVNSFHIVSGTLNDGEFTSSIVSSGKAPVLPGNKAVVAAKIDKHGAQILERTFDASRSITDVSVVFNYEYTVLMEAAEGEVTYQWELLHKQGDTIAIDYIKKELDNEPEALEWALEQYQLQKDRLKGECKEVSNSMDNLLVAAIAADKAIGNTSGASASGGAWEYYAGETLMRKIYDYLEETEVITLKWSSYGSDDERVAVIENAFFEYFLNGFADEQMPELISNPSLVNNLPGNVVKEDAEGAYSFKSCTKVKTERSRNKTLKFEKIILPVKRSHQMVYNLAGAYDELNGNDRYVKQVVLDDPFYAYRDILFILDLDAEDLFGDEVNYVTINVRKHRSDGSVFTDKLTIDRNYLRRKGGMISTSYVRGADTGKDDYEYKVQWSLRGGKVFPKNPRWKKGDWEGVTLAAPVTSQTISFEADPGTLSDLDIVRTSLEIRHKQFQKEVINTIPLSITRDEFAKDEKIYSDLLDTNFDYRLVFIHKRKGRLISDWIEDNNYSYVWGFNEQLLELENE